MFKNLFITVIAALFFQNVSAQQPEKDTLLFLLKTDGRIVSTKDSADYIMFNLPVDQNTGLHKVVMISRDGSPKLIANSKTREPHFRLEGACSNFFPNGKKRSVAIYKNGVLAGDILEYYPNGKAYTLKNAAQSPTGGLSGIILTTILNGGFDVSKTYELDRTTMLYQKAKLMQCQDSTGKILAENGRGHWLEFDGKFKNIISEGPVLDGVKNGEWRGEIIDTLKYICKYDKGIAGAGTGFDKDGRAHKFSQPFVAASYPDGMWAFDDLIVRALNGDPKFHKKNRPTGKIFVSFSVETDGSVANVQIVKGVSEYFDGQVVQAVRSSKKWRPAYRWGIPARTEFTLPIDLRSE